MSDVEPTTYDIGEFVSYELEEIDGAATFRIVLEGPGKYAALIAHKVGTMRISQEELDEWTTKEGRESGS